MNKVRWGIIGVGDIANKRVAAAIQNDPQSELIAVCRRSEVPLNAFADQFAVPHRWTDANDLIAMPEMDAVYIATPVNCHCTQTVAAARSGKHVLVEKPMALDVDQCDQMIAECEDAGVVLGVAYYRRFYPVVARVAELIRTGVLGRVLTATCVTGNPVRFPADDWRVVRSTGGGGPLMDIGSHRIDLFLQLFGNVNAVKSDMIASPNYEAEQVATLLMQTDSGVQATLQCYFGTVNTPDRLEIIGTDGRVQIEDLNTGNLTLFTNGGRSVESHPPANNLHGPLIKDFTNAVIHGRSPAVSGVIGKQTNEVIRKAYNDSIVMDEATSPR